MKHLVCGKLTRARHEHTWLLLTFSSSALYLLYIQYAAPSGTFDEETFAAVKSQEETETTFNWPKISWIFVFQYPIIESLCVALQEVTEATGRFCLNSLSPMYAHLWVEIIVSPTKRCEILLGYVLIVSES